MTAAEATPGEAVYNLRELADFAGASSRRELISSDLFSRARAELPGGATLLRDEFPSADGASCVFVRIPTRQAGTVRFVVDGSCAISACAAGGWLLEARQEGEYSYWVPQPPALRGFDSHGRIVREEPARITGFQASDDELSVSVGISPGLELCFAFWSIGPAMGRLCAELKQLSALEQTKAFLWSSQSTYQSPAGLYQHLIDGRVYQNALAWPRKWRFCCDLDGYELFVWLTGLERATRKTLYSLLRRQLALSTVARQSADGGWYHGEWTDMNECHYRFHNGALLLLENAADEWRDDAVSTALRRGVEFVVSHTDRTDLGLWFLHDSLEESTEALDAMHAQTGALAKGFGAWKPSRMLGKSPTNKMILNTHLDTTITVDRYREQSGDTRFTGQVDSARSATRSLLRLRPAETLYRAVYRAVGMTLLPADEARQLPVPLRAMKRLVWMYLTPNLYRLKRLYPRIVMPGGFVDRHLAPLHFDAKYHAVNIMDLVRHLLRFPEDHLDDVVDEAIRFVVRDGYRILRWWAEAKPRQFAIVVFAEALYQLCLMRPKAAYRSDLAATLLLIEDLGLGMPPSLLGGNAELIPPQSQAPCPRPADRRLRVVNLNREGHKEMLVVNPAAEAIEVVWEGGIAADVVWTEGQGGGLRDESPCLSVPPRGWLWGRPASRG